VSGSQSPFIFVFAFIVRLYFVIFVATADGLCRWLARDLLLLGHHSPIEETFVSV
jgi:hypothetical protein